MSKAVTWTIRNLETGSVREGLSRTEAELELRRAIGAWAPQEEQPQAERDEVQPRAEREVALAA